MKICRRFYICNAFILLRVFFNILVYPVGFHTDGLMHLCNPFIYRYDIYLYFHITAGCLSSLIIKSGPILAAPLNLSVEPNLHPSPPWMDVHPPLFDEQLFSPDFIFIIRCLITLFKPFTFSWIKNVYSMYFDTSSTGTNKQ